MNDVSLQFTFTRGGMMDQRSGLSLFCMALVIAVNFPVLAGATDGTAKGEATDEKGQQGLGLHSGSESSNVIKGGPEIIEGKITGIDGEKYSIQGARGQNVTLRVTKDTNKVCAKGQGTQFSTGQESAKEHHEIAPTASMEKQTGKSGQDIKPSHQDSSQKEMGALSKDPSKLKDVVGTTDSAAKEDVARGSGFVVGGVDCKFKAGDQVRIEASDMGTATTISQLSQSSGG
jgi:hypothetical protein